MSAYEKYVIIARVNIIQHKNSSIKWTLVPEEYLKKIIIMTDL